MKNSKRKNFYFPFLTGFSFLLDDYSLIYDDCLIVADAVCILSSSSTRTNVPFWKRGV